MAGAPCAEALSGALEVVSVLARRLLCTLGMEIKTRCVKSPTNPEDGEWQYSLWDNGLEEHYYWCWTGAFDTEAEAKAEGLKISEYCDIIS